MNIFVFAFAFALENTEETLEEEMIDMFCKENKSYSYRFTESPMDCIPIGSVEWCEKVYGSRFVPDYYPRFLRDYLYRNVWKSDYKVVREENREVFIKPYRKYKKWTGFVYTTENGDKGISDDEQLWCSEIVHFINEWRYYIIKGEVFASAWYDGDISDTDVINGLSKAPPELPLDLLTKLKKMNYYGVIDMGEIMVENKLTLALVEACHPYAIGWYLGSDSYLKYAQFIIESDLYLRESC